MLHLVFIHRCEFGLVIVWTLLPHGDVPQYGLAIFHLREITESDILQKDGTDSTKGGPRHVKESVLRGPVLPLSR